MSDPLKTVQNFQDVLKPHIKPREQTNYIRRILALHVKTSVRDGSVKQPLSLPGAVSGDQPASSDLPGVYRDFARALAANSAARRQFDSLTHAAVERGVEQGSQSNSENVLDDQIAILRLRQKKKRLSSIQQYLDQLLEQPAALPGYLDPERILRHIAPLPSVPREVVNSIAIDKRLDNSDIGSGSLQLEKTVLKAKLLLKREEQMLQELRSNSRSRPDVFSNAARLAALSATRTELITWIEAELSVASADEESHGQEGGGHEGDSANPDPSVINAQLSEITSKYSKYLACRKELVSLLTAQPSNPIPPQLNPDIPVSNKATRHSTTTVDHLLTPSLEKLISLSNHQKSLIAQKSHVGATLEKCTQDTCQMLGHLAEESQLLPAYPLKDSMRRRSKLADEFIVKKSDIPDLSTRVKPWVFAADAAKIANLESVTETIEEGQISLEHANKVLADIETLLGLANHEPQLPDDTLDTEEDFWLGSNEPKETNARKHTETGKAGVKKGDVWSTLHGNLGLIGQEEAV